ncbi:MAG: hypothetical protein RLO19_05640, partial [Coleofasciculus sp. G2-EDA-02]
MKNTQYQNRWEDASQPKRLRFRLYFSLLKGIDDHRVSGKGWFSSISVGLLVILIGIIGIIPGAKADELSQEREKGDWQREDVNASQEAVGQLIRGQTPPHLSRRLSYKKREAEDNTLSESIAQSHSREDFGSIEPARMESPLDPLPNMTGDEGAEEPRSQSVGAGLTDNLTQETDNLTKPARFDQSVGAGLTDNLTQETDNLTKPAQFDQSVGAGLTDNLTQETDNL